MDSGSINDILMYNFFNAKKYRLVMHNNRKVDCKNREI